MNKFWFIALFFAIIFASIKGIFTDICFLFPLLLVLPYIAFPQQEQTIKALNGKFEFLDEPFLSFYFAVFNVLYFIK